MPKKNTINCIAPTKFQIHLPYIISRSTITPRIINNSYAALVNSIESHKKSTATFCTFTELLETKVFSSFCLHWVWCYTFLFYYFMVFARTIFSFVNYSISRAFFQRQKRIWVEAWRECTNKVFSFCAKLVVFACFDSSKFHGHFCWSENSDSPIFNMNFLQMLRQK